MALLTTPLSAADAELMNRRSALRDELNAHDELTVEYIRLMRNRDAIQARIDSGEVTPAAHRQNEAAIARVHKAMNRINNVIPNELLQTAPESLKQTLRDCIEDKKSAIARHEAAKRDVQKAEDALHMILELDKKTVKESARGAWSEKDHASRRIDIADAEHNLRSMNRQLSVTGEDLDRAMRARDLARQACILTD